MLSGWVSVHIQHIQLGHQAGERQGEGNYVHGCTRLNGCRSRTTEAGMPLEYWIVPSSTTPTTSDMPLRSSLYFRIASTVAASTNNGSRPARSVPMPPR